MLKPRLGESIQEKRPDLLDDWDYEKNEVTPDMVSFGARKLIYWKCHKCGHEWVASANRRTTNKVVGMGCKVCGQKVRLEKCKETRKQNSLVPKTFNCRFTKFVKHIPENILKCPDCNHTWTIDSSKVVPYTEIKCPKCSVKGDKGMEFLIENIDDIVKSIEDYVMGKETEDKAVSDNADSIKGIDTQ